MQRIAKARPWADACLHANPPGARRARAKPRAATRFRGRALAPSPARNPVHPVNPVEKQPRTLSASATQLSLR